MQFVKRRGSTKVKVTVKDFEILKAQYLEDIRVTVMLKKIPPQLVINWDHTGIKIVPASNWTMDERGAERVGLTGIDDKRQITGVLGCTLSGDFLPPQVIYSGKTKASLPKFEFPKSLHVTFKGRVARQKKIQQ